MSDELEQARKDRAAAIMDMDAMEIAHEKIKGAVFAVFRQRIATLQTSGSAADRKRLAEAELLFGRVKAAWDVAPHLGSEK